MRIDKYLKVSRLVKRRTLAQGLCLGGHVRKNGLVAKPATSVQEGDIIEIDFGSRVLTVRVRSIRESADKQSASDMYELVAGR